LLPQRIYDGLGNVSHFGQRSRPYASSPAPFAVTEDLQWPRPPARGTRRNGLDQRRSRVAQGGYGVFAKGWR